MYLNHDNLKDYWVIDIETDGLDPKVVWCICVKNIGTGERRVFRHPNIDKSFIPWVSLLPPTTRWVAHNGISFDIPVLRRLVCDLLRFSDTIDTFVLSTLYDPNMVGGHSLDEWGRRLAFKKGVFNDWSHLSDEMVEYCERDVDVTEQLFLKLTARMKEKGFSEQSCMIEHRIRYVIDKQQRNGFYFDRRAAEGLYLSLREREEELGKFIHQLFPPELKQVARYRYRVTQTGEPFASYKRHVEKYNKIVRDGEFYDCYDFVSFNIGSPAQRIEKLLSLGWKPRHFTPKGNPKVDEESLVEYAEESNTPEVKAIADWLVTNGRANMVNTWLGYVQPDSCIHGKVYSCGASTRRMTHNSPNTANIPGNEAKYGIECRSLWTARPGRLLVGFDASSLEQIMFLNELGAPRKLVDQYLQGDPHQDNADALTEALKAPVSRRQVKTIFYAFMYGASNGKLGNTAIPGGGASIGKVVRETLYKNTPGLKELIKRIGKEFEKNSGMLKMIDGGYNRCPSPHAALNYKLQGNGAIVMKLASIILDDKITSEGWDVLKVGDIHDEGQLDSDPAVADMVGKAAVSSIEEAGRKLGLLLPITGTYSVGNNWADTH